MSEQPKFKRGDLVYHKGSDVRLRVVGIVTRSKDGEVVWVGYRVMEVSNPKTCDLGIFVDEPSLIAVADLSSF